MKLPESRAELEALVSGQVQESIHLDYKDSRAVDKAKRSDIAKDVTAFANSDGGVLIYGISERGHLPIAIDSGVDHTKYSREWLEQVINSNVSPRIDGVRISQVPLPEQSSAYCVEVPKSHRAPHQETRSNKYFKRFNFQSVPMEDYEIRDVRSRISLVRPLVSVDIELRHRNMVYVVIENISQFPVKDVVLEFEPELPWDSPRDGLPPLVKNGAGVPGTCWKGRG